MADFAVQDIFKTIDELAPQYGLDPGVAKSIIIAENTKDGRLKNYRTFSGDATNSNQTMGIGQVIPSTARGLQQAGFLPADWKHDPSDVRSQLSASLAAMKEMRGRQRNPDDPFELGAMYNGGNAAWRGYQAGEKLNPETTQYLQKMRTGMAELNMTPQQIERAASQPTAPLPGGTRRGTSSSTSTSRNVFDDGAMDNFLAQSGLLQDAVGNAQLALDDRASGVAAQGQNTVQAIMSAGEAAGTSAMMSAALQAAGQERRAALLTRANLHPEQENNRMDRALRVLDETTVALEQKRPEIDARMAVGFFDNPLEYVVNQVRLPGMISEYNGLVGVQKDALSAYESAQNITSSAINMSQAIDADKTLAAGAALAKAEAAKFNATAQQTQLQLRQKTAADALQSVQLANVATENSLKQLMLTKQVEAIRQGESEAAARVSGEKAALSEFNMLVEAAGGKGIAFDRFKQLTPKAREEILTANSAGRFGGNFVDALKFVENYGNLDNMAVNGQLAVRTWINSSSIAANGLVQQAQTAAIAGGKGASFNPSKAKEDAFRTVQAQYEQAANGDMRNQPEANPYKINYKNVIKSGDWTGNAFVETMAKYGPDGSEKQFRNYDEQAFIQRAVTMARMSGDPAAATKKLAADVSSFYKKASRDQQMITKPQMFGLSTPAKTYPVALPAYSSGQIPLALDLGDAAAVENFLTRQVAKEIAEQNPFSIAGARASSGRFGLSN